MTVDYCSNCGAAIINSLAQHCPQCGVAFHAMLAPGMVVAGQYAIQAEIGSGGMGEIYLVEDRRMFNRRCVLKRVTMDGDATAQERFAAEAQTLTTLRHPQIPQIYAFFSESGNAYIVMEHIVGRDLSRGLSEQLSNGKRTAGQPLPAAQVVEDGAAICSILEYLHGLKPPVVHCDIKPANLIRDRDRKTLFLVDFGAAAFAGSGENFGTPGYAAPELYRRQRQPASDIYALAATMYHLLTDDDPGDRQRRFPKLDALPAALRAILERCLDPEPSRRPSAGQLRADFARLAAGPLSSRISAAPAPSRSQPALPAAPARPRTSPLTSGRPAAQPAPSRPRTAPLKPPARPRPVQHPSVRPVAAPLAVQGSPTSLAQFVSLAKDDWQHAQMFFSEYKSVERLLEFEGKRDLAVWVQSMKASTPRNPSLVMDRLLRTLDPAFPAPVVRANLAAVDLRPHLHPYSTVEVPIRDGGGEVRVVSRPVWLQADVNDLQINLAVSRGYQNRQLTGVFEFDVLLGTGQLERQAIEVRVVPQNGAAAANPSGWVVLIPAGVMMLMLMAVMGSKAGLIFVIICSLIAFMVFLGNKQNHP